MKFSLTWSDVDRTEESGTYPFRSSTVEIRPMHLAEWKVDPEGVWEVISYRPSSGPTKYGLRRFQPSVRGRRPAKND